MYHSGVASESEASDDGDEGSLSDQDIDAFDGIESESNELEEENETLASDEALDEALDETEAIELEPITNVPSESTSESLQVAESLSESAEFSIAERRQSDLPQEDASLDASATNLLTRTRTGRSLKRRDMSGLSLCLCGEAAVPGDARSIRCQRAGCETVWVSNPCA